MMFTVEESVVFKMMRLPFLSGHHLFHKPWRFCDNEVQCCRNQVHIFRRFCSQPGLFSPNPVISGLGYYTHKNNKDSKSYFAIEEPFWILSAKNI